MVAGHPSYLGQYSRAENDSICKTEGGAAEEEGAVEPATCRYSITNLNLVLTGEQIQCDDPIAPPQPITPGKLPASAAPSRKRSAQNVAASIAAALQAATHPHKSVMMGSHLLAPMYEMTTLLGIAIAAYPANRIPATVAMSSVLRKGMHYNARQGQGRTCSQAVLCIGQAQIAFEVWRGIAEIAAI